jgi:hypothetical protein
VKVSIDLDGTLFAHPEFFVLVGTLLQAAGHQVGILTGHKADAEEHDRKKLAVLGFTPDFYLGRTEAYMPLNGAHFKSDMIREHNIDIHFDDLDYCHPDTTRLFKANKHANDRVFVVPAREKREWTP